jgi:outer membrane receptor protein involved in Fe transport
MSTSRGISALLLACTSATGVPAMAIAAEAATAAPAEELGEVVVTGSRVITNGDNSPTPVTVVSYDDLQTVKPGPIADGLNQLPIFAGSRGQGANSNPSINGGIGGGNGVANQMNMRNLGTTRNLILFDGMRIPATTFAGIVDLDLIPQNLVQRVDMVTGGVSAVYGSDAVTGVINFITNRNFDGVKAHGSYGLSARGDGDQFDAGIAGGKSLFGGRGHLIGSYEYRDDMGADRKSSRSWNQDQSAGGLGTAANPYFLVTGARNPTSTFGGRINNNALSGYSFVTDGAAATPQVLGAATGNNNVRIGGDGVFGDVMLKGGLKSHQLFGRLDFDFTDDVHGNVVAAANLKTNEIWDAFVTLQPGTTVLSRDNAFLPAATRTAMPVAQTTFQLSKQFYDYALRYHVNPDSDQLFFAAGLDGKLGDYKWDVALWRGDSKLTTNVHNNINQEKLAAALDAVAGPNGTAVCASANIRPDCVPLNPFGPTAYSQASMDYFLDDNVFVANTVMDAANAAITGAPFGTWAGPVNMALSGEWRKVSYSSTSDHPPDLFANCAGLTRNCTASGPTQTILYRSTLPNRSKVSQTVKEAAFEFDAPLLNGVALAQQLNLNGAVRRTSYDTSGDYTSWKAGLDWHVNDQLRFRATRSRDIRAPNLFDIASSTTNVPQTINTDPLTGVNSTNQIPGPNVANPDLVAEIGQTTTAGIVWKPDALSGLSVALDWYYIKIEDAINTVQGFQAGVQAACADAIRAGGNGSNFYCSLQSRAPSLVRGAGVYAVNGPLPTAFYTTQYNLGSITTKGADLEVNYQRRILDRPFRARLLVSYQPHLLFSILPGTPVIDAAGFVSGPVAASLPTPVWRTSMFLGYDPSERLAVDVLYRWRSSLGMSSNPAVFWNYEVPSHDTTNLNLAYKMGELSGAGRSEVFVNLSNLFDQGPPLLPGTGTPGGFGGWPASDDWIGRYVTVGFRYTR